MMERSSGHQDQKSQGNQSDETTELSPFEYQTLSGSSQIRVVSILPGKPDTAINLELEHVDLDSDPKYECLSYAWGIDDRDQTIILNGSAFSVSSTLYTALEHLRHETHECKIWIDAISINQSNLAERSSQVAVMRRIYQNAARVNVWLGPATESSEQAMAFLKLMATAKKNADRGHYIGGIGRLASDTSSELGPGEERGHLSFSRAPTAPSNEGDRGPDTQSDDVSISPFNELISEHQNPTDNYDTCSDVEADETQSLLSPPEPSADPYWEEEDQVRNTTIWEKVRKCFRKLYVSLRRRYLIRKGQQAYSRQRREYRDALATVQATKNDFAFTGFPVLYDMFGDCREEYFSNKWESHWQALDELLARPWWGRTWIVQEVWSASDAVLQCGTTTIKWKTLQKAMDYSEAWDDMGDLVKKTERASQWDTLRRRYTLAIHLTKARVNGSTLSSLLWNTWDRASTDPRDKVFAMLALVDQADHTTMAPDYSKSVIQVYQETAREIIVKQGQLDILLAASGVSGSDDLPSWVPDWRCEANAKKPVLLVNRHMMMKLYISGSMDMVVLDGHGYRAAGNSEATASFNDDLSVLTVLGRQIDSIAEVCYADITELQDDDFTDKCFDFVLKSKFVSFWARRRETNKRKCTANPKSTTPLLTTLTAGGTEDSDKRAPTMRNIMRQRRLFITRNGRFGIGPVDAQSGDVLHVISGCNFPIMLRPRGDKFAVVGEVYSECLNVCGIQREPADMAYCSSRMYERRNLSQAVVQALGDTLEGHFLTLTWKHRSIALLRSWLDLAASESKGTQDVFAQQSVTSTSATTKETAHSHSSHTYSKSQITAQPNKASETNPPLSQATHSPSPPQQPFPDPAQPPDPQNQPSTAADAQQPQPYTPQTHS